MECTMYFYLVVCSIMHDQFKCVVVINVIEAYFQFSKGDEAN